jgi:hypothetical protein
VAAPRAPLPAELHAWGESHGQLLNLQVAAWLERLVEDPGARLDAADRAAGWLGEQLAAAVERVRQRLAQVREALAPRRAELAAGEPWARGGPRWLGLRRGPAPANPAEPFLDFCRLCFAEVSGEAVLSVLEGLATRLTERVRDLALARERLLHCAAFFRASAAAAGDGPGAVDRTELLPEQAPDRERAAEALLRRHGAELLRVLDVRLQADVLGPNGGLWGLAVTRHDLAAVLERQLRGPAREAVREVLNDLDVAKLFVRSHGDGPRAAQALAECAEAAKPRLMTSGCRGRLFAALPDGPAGAVLRERLAEALADAPALVPGSAEDILLVREVAGLDAGDVARAPIGIGPGHAELARQVLTRVDVAWSPFAAGEAG